ncbi:glycogen debranching protein GlgX [Vibrio rhizosphaerae]|uniref:Glycogen debranching protein GlgX n=1 Tax=Vibrio rhizosphaerae TaxID=398736 RepID=A0ABU4J1I4_9VIBR|nr:glycogen debranching protein GlgX [Vibrio rhizosphaerae]MDW6094443.1 glycogen debranching protein GlgX [Vibrio rhizosphaerae]
MHEVNDDVRSQPYPLGATLDTDGCNFAIYAPGNPAIRLALFDEQGHYESYPLDGEYAGIRFTYLPAIRAGQKYGYLLKLPNQKKWQYIADPYAKSLDGILHYDPPFTIKSSFELAKCLVVDDRFDWQGTTRPNIPREKTVLFETHVKGLTQQHPDIPSKLRGKYLGLIHPEMMAFYDQQHIKTLQLLPIAACMHESHLLETQQVNYWGYNPYLFMVPDPRYAIDDPVTELKTVIRTLHQAGIEVILDVVYNHTAEGGADGPVFNLKGLDPKYYITHENDYANFTGCGNTVDLAYQPSLNLVMDTLRYWVSEYHIDGFRFDLAATLGRSGETFSPDAAFFKAVAQDPVLKQTKLIAEPWDIGPNGYQVGNFPFGWNETNDKLRDISRSFWRGDQGYLKEFATRIMGSRDLYSAANWPFKLTVNYITYHDGFTLQDLVSYKHKHNEANGEQNRDGHGDNRSDNYGVEGPTKDAEINKCRMQQKRNFMVTVLFSFGIPHLLTADLLSHTQQGNNNAYCQDNEISWLQWQLGADEQQFQQWLGKLVVAREQYMVPFIQAFSGDSRNSNRVFWRKVDGSLMTQDDWNQLNSVSLHLGIGDSGDEILYLINRTKAPARFSLPEGHQTWQVLCDTASFDIQSTTTSRERLQPAMSFAILYCASKDCPSQDSVSPKTSTP